MGEYQAGRTSAVFAAGAKVENVCETYDSEVKNLEAMKLAFGMAGKSLENYREVMLKELQDAKIPLREAEYGKVYIARCVELMRQLFNDTEAKRLQAKGAAEAMRQTVTMMKRLYDEERTKLSMHEEYENDPEKELKNRPPGVHPGEPIVEYKAETDKISVTVTKPEKKKKERRVTRDT